MEKKYARKGLKIVAPEVQGSAEDAIKGLVEEHKMTWTITSGISGPRLANGIPHMAVFDVSGKLVWSGHPMDDAAEDAIKDALKEAKGDEPEKTSGLGEREFLIEERTWTNSEGQKIQASVLSVTGGTIKFRFPNGRTYDYDMTKLSAEDQKVIKEATGGVAGE